MKNIFAYRVFAMGSIAGLGFRFLQGVVIAQICGPLVYGTYLALLVAPTIAVRVFDLSLPQSLTYYVRRDTTLINRAALIVLVHTICSAPLYFLVAYAQCWLPAEDANVAQEAARAVWLVVAVMVSAGLWTGLSSLAIAAERFWLFALINILSPLATLAGAWLSLTPTSTVGDVLRISVAAEIFAASIALISFWMIKQGEQRGSLGWREAYHYGARAHPGLLLKVVGARLDRVLLLAFVSPTALAYYSVAATLRDLVAQPVNMYSVVLTNRFISLVERPRELASYVQKNILACTAFLCISLMIVVPLSPWIFVTFYGPSFRPSASLFQILAPSVLFSTLAGVFWSLLFAKGRPGTVSRSILLSSVPATILLVALTALYGAPGAAWASTVGQVMSAAMAAAFAWQLIRVRREAEGPQ